MPEDSLMEIVKLCLSIDQQAVRIYTSLSALSGSHEIKAFWEKMSLEETEHVQIWQHVIQLVERGVVPQLFESPEEIRKELEAVHEQVNGLMQKSMDVSDISTSFLIAYRLEFYLLHRAFGVLFHYVEMIDPGLHPEEEYEAHISKFIEALDTYGTATPEMELLGETLKRLWYENRDLTVQSTTDELTGLLNRRGFFNLLKPLSSLAQRSGISVGFMMIDIDSFKYINDTYGHEKGDEVLRKIASILKHSVRSSDIVGRIGGEEFVIFLSSTDAGPAFELAEKIRKKVEKGMKDDLKTTVSVGLSTGRFSMNVDEANAEFIKRADSALYDAKKTGKNKTVKYAHD